MGYPAYGAPISLGLAKKCAAAAEAEALKNGWEMVIVVVDSGANTVLLHRMDNAHLGSVYMAEEKARTAVKFRRDTKSFQDALGQGGANLRMLAADPILPVDGGMPLIQGGKIIGAIGVSGAQGFEDAQCALEGVAAL